MCHHSTVWAALSALIAPRDMLSLINSESTDPQRRRQRKESGEMTNECVGEETRGEKRRRKGKERKTGNRRCECRRAKNTLSSMCPLLQGKGEVKENWVTGFKKKKKKKLDH